MSTTTTSMEQFRKIQNKSISPVTPQKCGKLVENKSEATNNVLMNSQTPKIIQHYLKRKVTDPNEVSQHVKRTILKIENDIIKEPKSKYFTAL